MSLTPDSRTVGEVMEAANWGDRRGDGRVCLLVLHYTGMIDGQSACAWLAGTESQVSCHYLVHEDGGIVQMVGERNRAWHAGQSCWRGIEDVNSASIGIEIVNPGHEYGYRAFPQAQIESLIDLCADILARHMIAPRDVVAHSDIAFSRKRDPGELFPWEQLAMAGIGLHVTPAGIGGHAALREGDRGGAVRSLQAELRGYGYCIEVNGEFDRRMRECVTAFQRHFRPARVDGIADPSTVETLRRLRIAADAEPTGRNPGSA